MKKRVIIWTVRVLVILLFAAAAGLLGINITLARVKKVEISKDDEKLGINEAVYPVEAEVEGENAEEEDADKNQCLHDEKKIINIALFGGDKRGENTVTHTDAVMVLTVDAEHKKLKLSSIMRDTYVDVYGHGKTKLTHAYSYGGAELAIRTLNENFSLNIRDYVFINFSGLEKLVDALGGVEVEVKEKEVPEINKFIEEMGVLRNRKPKLLKSAGVQNLNGEQALSYCRIRYVGNGDFERTDRQRRVMEALLHKIEDAGPLKLPKLVATLLPFVETSLSEADILKLGTYVFTSGIGDVEQMRFPMDGYCKGEIINKVWYLVSDIPSTREHMHQFIYHDIIPDFKEPLD